MRAGEDTYTIHKYIYTYIHTQVLEISGITAEWRKLHYKMLQSLWDMIALKAMTGEINVVCNMTPYELVNNYVCFGEKKTVIAVFFGVQDPRYYENSWSTFPRNLSTKLYCVTSHKRDASSSVFSIRCVLSVPRNSHNKQHWPTGICTEGAVGFSVKYKLNLSIIFRRF
jgi:hypothetical protein